MLPVLLTFFLPLLIPSGTSGNSPQARAEFSDVVLPATEGERIEMSIHSPERIAGLQFQVEYDPEKILLGKPEFSPSNRHFSLFSSGDSAWMKIVAFSEEGRELDLSTPVLSIPLSRRDEFKGTVNLIVKDFVASTPEGKEIRVKVAGGTIHILPPLPDRFQMSQNFPNPFNHKTVIRFDLPEDAVIHLAAYTVLGERVRVLKNGVLPAGTHEVTWDGRDESGDPVSPGEYVCSLKVGANYHTMKMVLLR
ncbi:MAG: FlgD immunoglobulin-like domain containing protein [Fidelibacterota bacterium]